MCPGHPVHNPIAALTAHVALGLGVCLSHLLDVMPPSPSEEGPTHCSPPAQKNQLGASQVPPSLYARSCGGHAVRSSLSQTLLHLASAVTAGNLIFLVPVPPSLKVGEGVALATPYG